MRQCPDYPDRYTGPSVPDAALTPGLFVVGAAALSLAVCVVTFALGHAGAGVVAAIVSMLAFGAGLSWLAMEGRRIRQADRRLVIADPLR